MISVMLKFLSALGLALLAPCPAQGKAVSPTAKAFPAEQEAFKAIRSEYARGIEPIFKRSCFDCHTRFFKKPWNYDLPFVKKKVDEDLEDARERLELSDGFPLEPRTEGLRHLKAVAKVIRRKSMPPFEYMLFHWGSGLSDEESAKIMQWAGDSLKKIMSLEDKNAGASGLSTTAKLERTNPQGIMPVTIP